MCIRINSIAYTCIPMPSASLLLELNSMIIRKSAKDQEPPLLWTGDREEIEMLLQLLTCLP